MKDWVQKDHAMFNWSAPPKSLSRVVTISMEVVDTTVTLWGRIGCQELACYTGSSVLSAPDADSGVVTGNVINVIDQKFSCWQ